MTVKELYIVNNSWDSETRLTIELEENGIYRVITGDAGVILTDFGDCDVIWFDNDCIEI